LTDQLTGELRKGGHAYVRNLAAAEAAVLNGQFNVAKVLRASAHAQRTLAMEAARLVAGDFGAAKVFQTILMELQGESAPEVFSRAPDADRATQAKLRQFARIRERLQDVIRRSLASLSANHDILESDVHQFLWGCYGCGYIAEGDRPGSCPVCGALGVEFEWFGPFYANTPEHLGQLTPAEISAMLEAIPGQVANAISKTSEDELRRKPSKDEWCVKEIIGHVIETDLLFGQRVRAVLEGQGIPVIPRSAPPWKLHEGKGYEELSAGELLERLRRARLASLELVRGLKPEHWMRQGMLMDTTTSVLDLGSWLTNHDRGHLAQIRLLCEDEGCSE
jgi:rubrerythrin